MPHYDITDIQKYSDYSLIFQAKDSNGVPLDLNGYNISSCIREKYSSITGAASFISQISVPESGICSANLTAAQTSGLFAGTYIYTIQVTSSDFSTSFNLLEGYLNINPSIPTC